MSGRDDPLDEAGGSGGAAGSGARHARWQTKLRREGRARSGPLIYFGLVPAIVVAVLLLGAAALGTSLQIEKVQQQTVFDATMSVVVERVDRLDKMIIAQDNAALASVDVGHLSQIARRWLPTAARETPTVRAILVLDLDHDDREVRAFVSRAPGAEDDRFRRLLVGRLLVQMDLATPPGEQLRHLHTLLDEQSLLVSYWQRSHAGRRYLVVAWHDAGRLLHEVMPQLFADLDRSSRMNVVDQQGRILFGTPIQAGGFTVGLPFPTTLYNWRLQVALTGAEGLAQRALRQRLVQLAVVGFAALLAVAGVVILVRASVTERRLAALRSEFVANVSHELKTPLASVRMFGELLLTGRVPSEDKRREYLQIIVGESERLTTLIDNVLDFARVERGHAAYELERGDVATTVGRAVEVLRYRAERQGIELRLRAQPSPAVHDARAIELCVMNVLDNALKYAKGTEAVEIDVGRAPGGEAAGAAVQVRIADLGPGIAPDEQERIFDRFVRGRSAREQHARGSGIGLALVKHIAESHGGSVRVQSPLTEAGRGSAFILTLPAAPS
ncbi:MAG: HAMP domain-containing histidine kinase [Deltaproteobacteria bacterium]|nr:HAMP domain-containing histidine kinase [Deltaproteobacteria bacterium]